MMRHRPANRVFPWALAVGTLITGILAVSLLVSLAGDSDWLPWNDNAAPQATAVSVSTPRPPPVLTSADKEIATDVALADPRVQALLVHHEHAVQEIGVAFREDQEITGVVIDISVNGPTRVSGEWAGSAWVDCETQPIPSPVTVAYRATYDAVDSILVLVNLDTRQVSGIGPRSLTAATAIGEREFLDGHTGLVDCRVDQP